MYDTIYLPSQRKQKAPVRTSVGISRFRNYVGKVMEEPKKAYQNGIIKVNEYVQLSQPAVIASPAPFSIPIRNAAYNLNADPQALYRTPRSGLLWRVVGKEGHDVQNDILAPAKTIKQDLSSGTVRNNYYYNFISSFIMEDWSWQLKDFKDPYIARLGSTFQDMDALVTTTWNNEKGEVADRVARTFAMVPNTLKFPEKLDEIYKQKYLTILNIIRDEWFNIDNTLPVFQHQDRTEWVVNRSVVLSINNSVEKRVKDLHTQALQEYAALV